jgi:small redox-active disulfide protein 2
MRIKILGSGCKSCQTLEENTRSAVEDLNLEVEIEKVTDFEEISKFNVLKTPALVIDEKVVSYGKVNSIDEIKGYLS